MDDASSDKWAVDEAPGDYVNKARYNLHHTSVLHQSTPGNPRVLASLVESREFPAAALAQSNFLEYVSLRY